MEFQYSPEAALVFNCTLIDLKEALLEVPHIAPDSRGWVGRIFSPECHKRGVRENLRIGRAPVKAQNTSFLPG